MKRRGIRLKNGQTWKIGNGTVKKVYELNDGLEVSNIVKIVKFHGCGLFEVQCIKTHEKFDIESKSLSSIISE